MSFAGINHLAVVIAALIGFVIGAIYYGALGSAWTKAAGLDPEKTKFSPGLFIISFVCELVMAYVLAGMISDLGSGQLSVWHGIVAGFFVWLGFMATTMVVNHRYQGNGWDLTLIDTGHWLLVAIAMGAVIGAIGT
ncbi:MAG: DUF1761 domain-containing protein [Salaquimonas sp.]|nr:DUF1761 domain-containing protein [Salaquimonas sp.]